MTTDTTIQYTHSFPAPADLPAYVADKRRLLGLLKQAWELAMAEFEAQHASLIAEYKAAVESVAQAEAALRDAGLAIYAEKGDKVPLPGVKIKLFTELDYDSKEAFHYALDHKIALALDRKAFDSLAKSEHTRPEFVTVTQVPKALLDKDMDAALKEAE